MVSWTTRRRTIDTAVSSDVSQLSSCDLIIQSRERERGRERVSISLFHLVLKCILGDLITSGHPRHMHLQGVQLTCVQISLVLSPCRGHISIYTTPSGLRDSVLVVVYTCISRLAF